MNQPFEATSPISDPSTEGYLRGRGRPSLEEQRTKQIIDAFIDLVASHGLEGVTLASVASRAGVKRPTIRHYVGNRSTLVHAAFTELKQRYDRRTDEHLGPEPTIDAVSEYLFGDAYTTSSESEDLAFACLLVEAQRDPDLADVMRVSYQTTIDRIAAATRRERPDLSEDDAAALAYQVLCLAEFNVDLQRLGFDADLGRNTAESARAILRHGRPSVENANSQTFDLSQGAAARCDRTD